MPLNMLLWIQCLKYIYALNLHSSHPWIRKSILVDYECRHLVSNLALLSRWRIKSGKNVFAAAVSCQKTLANMPGQRSPSPGTNHLNLVQIYSTSLKHLPNRKPGAPLGSQTGRWSICQPLTSEIWWHWPSSKAAYVCRLLQGYTLRKQVQWGYSILNRLL